MVCCRFRDSSVMSFMFKEIMGLVSFLSFVSVSCVTKASPQRLAGEALWARTRPSADAAGPGDPGHGSALHADFNVGDRVAGRNGDVAAKAADNLLVVLVKVAHLADD